MKKLIIITLLLFTTVFLFAEPELARKALVVGNSTYEAGALTNPENDAESMAEVLKNAGFEVILTTNRNLRQMEGDLRSLRQSINKGDIALFFYAGHGVQMDGQNYLLPINNKDIANNSDLKRRSIDAQDYVTAMADSGASLNIVMLDACRDNPFLTSASRSGGSRGLAVMSAPRDTETVIVYATKAGDVAQDGSGSNSTFTTAFLDVVNTPDLDLLVLLNEVGTKVKQETGGKQIPTIYTEPLSRSFSFFSSKKQAEEARQASAIAKAEVEAMEAKISALQAQFEKSRNDKEKQEIELERKRQEALLAAQRLQADNLAAEADRRAADAARAEAEAKQRAADAADANERQNELAKLAAARRGELEKLSQDAESEDPDILIATIERLESVI